MAVKQVGVIPVVDRLEKGKLRGFITQFELLSARDRILQEERKRERILHMWPVTRYGNGLSRFFPPIESPGDTNDT
jgi:hypothetical protein